MTQQAPPPVTQQQPRPAASSAAWWGAEQPQVFGIALTVVAGVLAISLVVLLWLKNHKLSAKHDSVPPPRPTPPGGAGGVGEKQWIIQPVMVPPLLPTQPQHLQCILSEVLREQEAEPTRIKAKGLLERRGSSASLTIELLPSNQGPPLVTPTRECTAEEYLQSAGNVLSRAMLRLCLRDTRALHREFWDLPLNHPERAPVVGCGPKNRYRSILPNERTRVKLRTEAEDSLAEYINANYLRGYEGAEKTYIATQGPLPHTTQDFWQLVWQEAVPAIVMVTRLCEQGRTKCEQYLPLEVGGCCRHGEVEVVLAALAEREGHAVRELRVQRGSETRRVLHFWYDTWPDHKTPAAARDLLSLAEEVETLRRLGVNQYLANQGSPLLASTNQGSPLLASTNQDSPLLASTNQGSPLLASTNQGSPLLASTNQDSPLLTSTNQDSPLLTSTNQGSPLLAFTNQSSPLLAYTNQSSPLLTSTNEGSPHFPSASQGSPLPLSTNQSSPLFPPSNQNSPHLPSTNHNSPLFPTANHSPLLTLTNENSPLFPSSNQNSPHFPSANKCSLLFTSTNQSHSLLTSTNQNSPHFPLANHSPLLTLTNENSQLFPPSHQDSPLFLSTNPGSPRDVSTNEGSPLACPTNEVAAEEQSFFQYGPTTSTADTTAQGPVLVHCSAGIGRTGCFIAVSVGINQLIQEGNVDILGIVCQMRTDRGGMIQTAEQYEFVHRALCLFEQSMPSPE